MPKPFVDYLPDWLGEINLTEPSHYKYRYAVENFHRIREAKAMFPQARDVGMWVVTDKLDCEPVRRFPCWRNDEFVRWTPDIRVLFSRVNERQDFDPIVMKGLTYWRFRFSVGVMVLEPYAPESPAKLEQRAEARHLKAQLAEIKSMPLFQIEILAEQKKEKQ